MAVAPRYVAEKVGINNQLARYEHEVMHIVTRMNAELQEYICLCHKYAWGMSDKHAPFSMWCPAHRECAVLLPVTAEPSGRIKRQRV